MADAQSVVEDETAATPGDAFLSLEAHIPGDRRQSLATGVAIPDRIRGAALFADISGFTPLTEALANELGPQRGAEELTANLNRVFHALIAELERFGGHVIYFSGDAITCWIDGDDGARATACALAMQKTMGELGEVVTPAGSRVGLAMKAAVAVGAARRFLVGNLDVQLIDVLAGHLIDALATAEHLAARSEVLLDRSALESLGDRVEVRELRVDPESGREFGVVASMTVAVEDVPVSIHEDSLPEDVVRRWLLPVVYERLSTGRGEFLAELRPAYPLFVRFGGIDYDNDEDAIAKLDDFIRRAQRILTTYGGNLLHLTLGDKGAYLCAVFGPPQAHEDDAARAAAAALELRELEVNHRGHRHPGRDHVWPAAQRHVRTPAAADVHVPRRRGQPLGASHVERATGPDLRLGAGASHGRRAVQLGAAPADDGEGQGRARLGVRADRFEAACVARNRTGSELADRRPLGRARHPRRQARRGARWTRADRRHFGRGGHG